MHELLLMCLEFFKTGLFAVGGGLATVPFLFEISEKHPDWFTASELADIIAVSESTPGPIGINIATFVGFKTHGFGGALLSTLFLVLPAFVIILFLSKFLQKHRQNKYLNAVFCGIRPAAAGLIAAVAVSMIGIALFGGEVSSLTELSDNFDVGGFFIFLAVLIATQIKKLDKIHPVILILISAAAGIVIGFLT